MDKIESNFELLGATAIEDKLQVEKAGGRREGGREGVVIAWKGGFLIQFLGTLQEGVPETIHDLTRAGIKVNILCLSILDSAMTGAYNVFHSQECASWLVEHTSTQGPRRSPEPSRPSSASLPCSPFAGRRSSCRDRITRPCLASLGGALVVGVSFLVWIVTDWEVFFGSIAAAPGFPPPRLLVSVHEKALSCFPLENS